MGPIAMKWYGWFLIGTFVAAMGLMLWFLPDYAPSGLTYSSLFVTFGVPTAAAGALLAGRGLWQAAS